MRMSTVMETGTTDDVDHDLHGRRNWEGLLPSASNGEQLNDRLRATLLRYGEFAQATYDGFVGDLYSRNFGGYYIDSDDLLKRSLTASNKAGKAYHIPNDDKYDPVEFGPKPSGYIFANAGFSNLGINTGSWGRLHAIVHNVRKDQDEARPNWMGYVALSEPQHPGGKRDLLFAWRGTRLLPEWVSNVVGDHLVPWDYKDGDRDTPNDGRVAMVHNGFRLIYQDRVPSQDPNIADLPTPREVVRAFLKRFLLEDYTGEIGTITVTGHSLGGALAHMCAYDIGLYLQEVSDQIDAKNRPKVTAFTFASPKVGNQKFADCMDALGVKVLRVVNKPDLVPKVPGVFSFIRKYHYGLCGQELLLDSHMGKALIQEKINTFLGAIPLLVGSQVAGIGRRHNLEMYLHLVATQHGGQPVPDADSYSRAVQLLADEGMDALSPEQRKYFDGKARDLSLVNKSDDCLHPEYGVPTCWWTPVLNKNRARYSGYWAERVEKNQLHAFQASRDSMDEPPPAEAHAPEAVRAKLPSTATA